MRALIAWLIDVRGHHRLTVDPAAANARAIHVYAQARVPARSARCGSTSASATAAWRDALLMELLASEFVREGVSARLGREAP